MRYSFEGGVSDLAPGDLARRLAQDMGGAGRTVLREQPGGITLLEIVDGPEKGKVALIYKDAEGSRTVYKIGRPVGSDEKAARSDPRDFPGRDIPGVPRPPLSWRVGSVDMGGGAPGYILDYSSRERPEEVVEFYRRSLPEAGWVEVASRGEEISRILGSAAVFEKDGSELMVIAERPRDRRGEVSVSLLLRPTGRGGYGR